MSEVIGMTDAVSETSVWVTSDLHFGHVNILTYAPQRAEYLGIPQVRGERPTPDEVTEMNEGIVRLWNRQVGYTDTVWVLGDVAMGRVDETIEYVKRLNGQKMLVMGNHDRPHPIMQKSAEQTATWRARYEEVGFEIMDEEIITHFDGVLAQVCHFPYTGDHSEEERYGEYRPADAGLPLVHGHVHDLWQTNGRQYNVGIDAWNGEFQTPEAIGDYFRSVGF
jgi:calcineurin-like phosphoesterase family protein